MDEKKSFNKRMVTFIVFCVVTLSIFFGTFAYFVFNGTTNENAVAKINTANLSLVFENGDTGTINKALNFNESITKKFTIKNTGSGQVIVKINWKNLINTYLPGSLTYTFKVSREQGGNYTEIVPVRNVPTSKTMVTKNLATHLVISPGETYYYELMITLNDLNVDQTADLNAQFSTEFSLVESTEENIDEEKSYEIGDEYCIGTECFYVIGQDETNYTLLSKYNLYVGNIVTNGTISSTISETDAGYGLQNSLALGDKADPKYATIQYSDNASNNYETSKIKPYIDNYVNYLNTTYNANATGRLINLEEIQNIGCQVGQGTNGKHGCDYPDYSTYEWVIGTTYWTGIAGDTNDSVYIVGGDGFFASTTGLSNNTNRGIRPVIIIPKQVSSNSKIPVSWRDNGIFSAYYEKAYDKLNTLSTEEKIGQLLVASYTNQSTAINAIENYHVGGVLFFEDAFTGKTITQVQNMTSELQSKAKIPLLLPVDEEGGRVVRISPNTNLVADELAQYPDLFFTNSNSKNAWKLAGELYTANNNTFEKIILEEQVRNALLKKLGLNFNFAPVVDIANPPAYISDRSFGQSPEITGQYAKTVIEAGKNSGVGHSLKHFPGYGNNSDTHGSSSYDETSIEELYNTHLVPFIAGINAGAEAVMIAHNITSAIDKDYPSSLSKGVHDLLFNDLGFTGLAMTDDLSMSAIGDSYEKQYLKAFQAGNHILLSSNSFATAHNEILAAVNDGTITQDELDHRAFKVLAWKYYRGLLSE